MRGTLRMTLVFGLVGLFISQTTGQDRDPFKTDKNPIRRSKKMDRDPFGSSSHSQDNPFNSSKTKQDRDPFGASKPKSNNPIRDPKIEQHQKSLDQQEKIERLQQQVAHWKATVDNLAVEVKHFKQALEDARQVSNALRELSRAQNISTEIKNQMHIDLVNTLLHSKEASDQLIGLRHLETCLRVESRRGRMNIPVNSVTLDRMKRLTDSENEDVKQNSIRVFINVHPSQAREVGFQAPGGTWKPIGFGMSQQESKIRAVLTEICEFQYDDVELNDFIEDLQDQYNLNVGLSSDVDSKMRVSFSSRGQSLGNALTLFTNQHELSFVVDNESLMILPVSSPNAMKSLTYNVRGLLTEKLDIEEVVEIATDNLGKPLKVNVLDEHRMIVRCTEPQHHRLSLLLGALSKVNN